MSSHGMVLSMCFFRVSTAEALIKASSNAYPITVIITLIYNIEALLIIQSEFTVNSNCLIFIITKCIFAEDSSSSS